MTSTKKDVNKKEDRQKIRREWSAETSLRGKIIDSWEKRSEEVYKETGTITIACVKKGISEWDKNSIWPDEKRKTYTDI